MAVLYLAGVLFDGTRATDPKIPSENPRMSLEVIQGTSNQIVCRITNPAGDPVAPVGDVILTVKQKPQDEPLALLEGTWAPLLGPGTAVFSWATSTMRYSPWGWYVYDVRLENGESVDVVIPASGFRLAPAV